jgi:beta-glucosidase
VFDWGQGVVTLRNVANGKVLGYNGGPFVTRDDQPNNWFVQQQFKLEQQPDGTYVIHYAGYETQESWLLFGDVNPAGRLTQTWYRSDADLPSILDYDIVGSQRTYQYFRGTPLYAFGHGLSYTRFRYGSLQLDRHGNTVVARIDVTNAGGRAGDEVVQLYTHQRASRVERAGKTLRAFARVHLAPGETRTVRLSFDTADLAIWDVTRDRWALERGTYDVLAGGASDDLTARSALFVPGETIPPRDLSRSTEAQNWDAQRDTVLSDETKASGTSVAATAGGAWLRFADSDLRGRPQRISAHVSKATPGGAAIVVRLDDPRRGRVLATVPVPSTGDPYAWTTVSAPLARTDGVHDVYLTFTAPLELSRFSLAR